MISYCIEIKNRLVILIISSVFILFVAYIYKRELLFLTVMQLNINNFNYKELGLHYVIFTDVREIFFVYFYILSAVGFQVLFAAAVYHSFVFLVPALSHKEYAFFKVVLRIVFLLAVVASTTSILVIIPSTWDFFIGFQDRLLKKPFNIYFEAKLSDYISFYVTTYTFFNIYVQVFIIPFCLLNSYFINLTKIKKFRKLYYFSFIVFSTVISPPDVFSQLFISLFFIIFYELFLLLNLFSKLSLTKTPPFPFSQKS